MSKVSVVLEFGSEQEAIAFLSSRSGAPVATPVPVAAQPVATPVPVAAQPVYQPQPVAQPAQAYAPQASQPPAAAAPYTPPPAMQPAPAAAAPQLPPGVAFMPTAPGGQPWSPTTIMPLMQQYGGSAHGVQGVQGVFKRYGFEPNVTKLDANQLAIVASHFASMQPA